jgi:tetratricopeptide (TPR) repeat protein
LNKIIIHFVIFIQFITLSGAVAGSSVTTIGTSDAGLCYNESLLKFGTDTDYCTNAIRSRELTHSDLAATYSNRGIISARKGDFEQALADHNKALELKPGLSQAHINRGNTYYHLGQFEAAIRDYKTALDKGDTPAYLPYYNYGLALIKLKRTQEAIKMLEKALAIAPEASQVKRKLEDLMEQ